MIFSNLGKIVEDHYRALEEESGYKPFFSRSIILFVFVIIPATIGSIFALYETLWPNFVIASATVFGVLTGFSINTLVLLLRYNDDEGYPLEKRTVQKTREFTLYTILIGIVILMVLLFGYLLIQISIEEISIGNFVLDIEFLISVFAYGLILHYFLTILTITHRLRTLIHGGALSR